MLYIKKKKEKKNQFSVRAAICGKNILTTPAVCGQRQEANEPNETARRLQREMLHRNHLITGLAMLK